MAAVGHYGVFIDAATTGSASLTWRAWLVDLSTGTWYGSVSLPQQDYPDEYAISGNTFAVIDKGRVLHVATQ
jgi:hypothetical protein